MRFVVEGVWQKQVGVGFYMKHNDTRRVEHSMHDENVTQDLLDREALSALMDDELSDFELRRLLQHIESKPDLLAEWERFGLVRAALQSDPWRAPRSPDFASRVLTDIEQSISREGPLSAMSDSSRKPGSARPAVWARNTTRFAVAASVTLAVFMGMQAVLQAPGVGESQPALASGNDQAASARQNQQLAVDADAQQRLNDYIRSVTIPARMESQSTPYNILLDSPQLHPVSDRALLEEVERVPPQP